MLSIELIKEILGFFAYVHQYAELPYRVISGATDL